MAGSVNKVILIGNLGKDPEIRRLENGTVIANFPLATSETFTDKATGTRRDITDWHNIVLWRNLAEIAEKYVRKGTKVYVEGKLKTRSWTDANGQQRYITEVVGDELTILTPRSESSNQNYGSNTAPYPTEPQNPMQNMDVSGNDEDDLPF
jgi:single-strand DNA-binding protein